MQFAAHGQIEELFMLLILLLACRATGNLPSTLCRLRKLEQCVLNVCSSNQCCMLACSSTRGEWSVVAWTVWLVLHVSLVEVLALPNEPGLVCTRHLCHTASISLPLCACVFECVVRFSKLLSCMPCLASMLLQLPWQLRVFVHPCVRAACAAARIVRVSDAGMLHRFT
jgi:hypothetical protein